MAQKPTVERIKAIRDLISSGAKAVNARNVADCLALLDEVFEKIGEAVEDRNTLASGVDVVATAKIDSLRSMREKYGVRK